jgi:hypothetical protein
MHGSQAAQAPAGELESEVSVEEAVCSRIAHVMRGAAADLGPSHPWWADLSGLAGQFELDAREAAQESQHHAEVADPPGLRLVS